MIAVYFDLQICKSDISCKPPFFPAGFIIKSFSPSLQGYLLGKEVMSMLFAPKEQGQGLVEYALILVLVAIVVIAVLLILGPIIGNVFTKINSGLNVTGG